MDPPTLRANHRKNQRVGEMAIKALRIILYPYVAQIQGYQEEEDTPNRKAETKVSIQMIENHIGGQLPIDVEEAGLEPQTPARGQLNRDCEHVLQPPAVAHNLAHTRPQIILCLRSESNCGSSLSSHFPKRMQEE